MIPRDTIQTILNLYEKGVSIREIKRLVKHSRPAIRRVIRENGQNRERPSAFDELSPLVEEQFRLCKGNAVRVLENLQKERGARISYSTLTRMIREMGLREEEKPRRSGEYDFGPGEEMEHDTSPHMPVIAGRPVKAECASLILGYSRKLYAQYYPRYTRLEARAFLTGAFCFFDGACPLCVIDNTSVIVARGAGAGAVMAPEMESFGDFFGFRFLAHEVGHADRKARVERNFSYIEGNFLAGRTFRDWKELNEQLLQWLVEIANKKPKRSLGMSPDEAYLMEKKRLIQLPAHIPPVYQTLHRVVDIYGYVNVDRNRYSAPERLVGKQVEVHKSVSRIKIYFKNRNVADHERCLAGRDAKIKAPGHHTPRGAGKKRRRPCREEKILVEADPWLSPYVGEIKKRSRGRGVRKMRDLLCLKRTYPAEAFEKAVRQALHYGLYDLGRLERLILSFVAGDFFDLDDE